MELGDRASSPAVVTVPRGIDQDLRVLQSQVPDVVWLTLGEGLSGLDRPMLSILREELPVARWQYRVDPDEASCFDTALQLLDQYLKSLPHPVHVVGHGMAGALGLVYSRWSPEQVKSLTLLSVSPSPANDWQAHYCVRRQHLPCGQGFVVSQMVREMFGQQSVGTTAALERLVLQDLAESLSPHSIWKLGNIASGGCPVPMFVAGSEDDSLVPPEVLNQWREWFKPGDRLWVCPQGRHFFHRFCADRLLVEILHFWKHLQ